MNAPVKLIISRWLSVLSLFAATLLVGCNTVEGAGRDVERAGEGIQNANCTGTEAQTDPKCQK